MEENKTLSAATLSQKVKEIVKNPQFYGFFISLVAIAIISFFYFYPDVVQGNELRQYDMQQGAANGQEVKEFYEETGERSMWTNSLFSGMPTFQISPYYESNSLFYWLNKALGGCLPYPANLLFMMMAGFLVLMYAFRVRWYFALLGSIAWGFSTYFIILIGAGHIWKFTTLAFIPPTIGGIVLCYRGRYIAGAAIAALFAMMQISSNHMQMTYYFLFVIVGIALAFLFIALKQKQIKQWGISTGALVVAAMLAAGANLPTLYNTYEYSKETIRGRHSDLTTATSGDKAAGGLDKDYILQYSYTPSETFTLLIPNVKGGATVKPEAGKHKPLTLYDLDKAQEMINNGEIMRQDVPNLQAFSQYFGAPEGTNGPVYVGAVIVALFLLGCIILRGPLRWILIALTMMSIFLSWGRYMEWFSMLFIDYVPMYSKFRTVESILVIAEFTMPLMAILALHKVFTTPDAWKRYRVAILVSFGVAMFFCFLGLVAPGVYGSYLGEREQEYLVQGLDRQMPTLFQAVELLRYSMVKADALSSLLYLIGGLAAMYFLAKMNKKVLGVAVIGLVIVADVVTVNKRYLDHDSFCTPELTKGEAFPMRNADRQILADTAMNYRVYDLQNFWSPSPSYYHKMVGGYHAAKLTRYQDLIERHLGRLDSEDDINVLNMLNTKYLIYDADRVELNPAALGNAWWVSEISYVNTPNEEMDALKTLKPIYQAVADAKFKDVLGTDIAPVALTDTIFETSYAPNRLTYHSHSANGGVAVFSEIYFPWGWKATIDGQEAPIGRVNYVLRAMRIPAGDHTIEMVFDPDSIKNTVTAARISIIAIYLALIAAALIAVVRYGKDDDNVNEPY